jgi:hypothetical protein
MFRENLWSCLKQHLFGLQIINRNDVQEAARETEGYFIKSGIITDAVIEANKII